MRSIDQSFYHSTKWKKTAASYMRSQNYLCEECFKKGVIVPAKIVHHIVHLNEHNVSNSELAYGSNNLMAVCQNCHNRIHKSKKIVRFEFSEDGELLYAEAEA